MTFCDVFTLTSINFGVFKANSDGDRYECMFSTMIQFIYQSKQFVIDTIIKKQT